MASSKRRAEIDAKIDRAEQHLESLKTEIRKFLSAGGYAVVGYDEHETGDRVVRLSIGQDLPRQLSLVLGDTIHNLRCALDHLAWQLTVASGGTPNTNTGFPIVDSVANLSDAAIQRRIPNATDEILRTVTTLEPYKDGRGDLLWRLHGLDIIDKHRLLITLASCNHWIDIRGETPIQALFPSVRPIRLPPIGIALQDGAELVRLKRADRTATYMDPRFMFQVAFGEVFDGEPVVPVCEKLSKTVKAVVDQFDPVLAAR